jgi:hypothetical protein
MRCSEMPGNASSRLPVTLRVLSREKADVINCAFEAAKRERVQIVSLVELSLGVDGDRSC